MKVELGAKRSHEVGLGLGLTHENANVEVILEQDLVGNRCSPLLKNFREEIQVAI